MFSQLPGQEKCWRELTKLSSLVPLQSPGFQLELGFQNYFTISLFVSGYFAFYSPVSIYHSSSLLITYLLLFILTYQPCLYFFRHRGHQMAFSPRPLCQNPPASQTPFPLALMTSSRILFYQLLLLPSVFSIFRLPDNMLLLPSSETNNNKQQTTEQPAIFHGPKLFHLCATFMLPKLRFIPQCIEIWFL